MLSKHVYDESQIDWPRLRAYAKRVSRETTLELDQPVTYQTTKQVSNYRTETRRSGFLGLRSKEVKVPVNTSVSTQIEALGKHWRLDSSHHSREDTMNYQSKPVKEESTYGSTTFALMPDGQLTLLCVIREETLLLSGNYEHHEKIHHQIGTFSGAEVEHFDFNHPYFESTSHSGGLKIHVWGNKRTGGKLLRHAKGVGLTLALKHILEGRTTRS